MYIHFMACFFEIKMKLGIINVTTDNYYTGQRVKFFELK